MEFSDKAEAVQRMQDYIEVNLSNEITLRELSAAAGYSPSYCSKIFKELTGKLPFEYLRSFRLTEAARILRDRQTRIIDIALDFVFDSHEGFTRAFSKEFGISPYKYKSDPVPLKYFIPYSVKSRFVMGKGERSMEKKGFIFTQVVERPKRQAIIKRGFKAADYYAYCEEVGCDVFGVLESIKEALYEPVGFWLPKKLIKTSTSEYVQGVEVACGYAGKIPEGYELIDLEPALMMVFQGEPYDDENFESAISEVWEAIEKFMPEIYGFKWSDDAPRFQLAPQGYRGYIEARPIKRINSNLL